MKADIKVDLDTATVTIKPEDGEITIRFEDEREIVVNVFPSPNTLGAIYLPPNSELVSEGKELHLMKKK